VGVIFVIRIVFDGRVAPVKPDPIAQVSITSVIIASVNGGVVVTICAASDPFEFVLRRAMSLGSYRPRVSATVKSFVAEER
jgi:hypothetical protein